MNLFKDFVRNSMPLTERLLQEVSDIDIYCELLGMEVDIGQPIISPLRADDDIPSFSFFIPTKLDNIRPDEVWWRDFRGGSGSVFTFVQKFAEFHYGVYLKTRTEIIKFIDNQLELGLFKTKKKIYQKRKIDYDKFKESKEILFTSREFTRRDIYWWALRGIDIPLLKRYNVKSLKYLLKEDYTIKKTFRQSELAFAFVVYDKVKIYRPEACKELKWRNTCPSEYFFGEEQLEGNDTLIITKSLKDIMSFVSFMKVDAIAPQSESMNFSQEFIDIVTQNYKTIYVVLDYDECGKAAIKKLSESTTFIPRWVSTTLDNDNYVIDKDISDYIINHGIKKGVQHMKSMFPELDEQYFKNDRIKYFEKLITNFIQI